MPEIRWKLKNDESSNGVPYYQSVPRNHYSVVKKSKNSETTANTYMWFALRRFYNCIIHQKKVKSFHFKDHLRPWSLWTKVTEPFRNVENYLKTSWKIKIGPTRYPLKISFSCSFITLWTNCCLFGNLYREVDMGQPVVVVVWLLLDEDVFQTSWQLGHISNDT